MRIVLALLAIAPLVSAADSPSAAEIVERSIARDQSNWSKAKDYTMVERRITRDLDGNGRVQSTKKETRDVMIIDGELYRRLIARDDKPLSAAEQKKEDERLRKFTAERQREDATRRQRRIAEREKRDQKGREIFKEIPRAYDLKLLGDDKIDGRDTWVIEATPRKNYKSNVPNAWILSKFRGKIWIDKQSQDWVKVDCESIDTVRIGLFLARLNKGARVMFEQTRVNDEIWLVRHALVRYDARLLIKRQSAEEERIFSDFKKFSAESRVVSVTRP